MPFTFKNYEINGTAAPALRPKNSPANPPHLTTAPLKVGKKKKKKRMEEEQNGRRTEWKKRMGIRSGFNP